jgi:hypothetical protein
MEKGCKSSRIIYVYTADLYEYRGELQVVLRETISKPLFHHCSGRDGGKNSITLGINRDSQRVISQYFHPEPRGLMLRARLHCRSLDIRLAPP